MVATAVYWQNAQFLPEGWLTELMRDGFGVSLYSGTLNNLSRKAAEAWEPCVERMQRWLRLAKRVAERGRKRDGVVSLPLWKLLERRYDGWV